MASLLVCGLGEWITPKVKGDCPPPCAGFTLTKISQNSAVLFGGFDSTTNTCLSDVYIVELSKESIVSIINNIVG